MVETKAEADDTQDYGQIEDEETDLPVYLTSDYLNQIYQSGESNDDSENNRTPSNNSNYSRPVSRYSKDFEDFDIMKQSSVDEPRISDVSERILEPFSVN